MPESSDQRVTSDVKLLPRRLIFADPERSVVRISHDGSRIAFLKARRRRPQSLDRADRRDRRRGGGVGTPGDPGDRPQSRPLDRLDA